MQPRTQGLASQKIWTHSGRLKEPGYEVTGAKSHKFGGCGMGRSGKVGVGGNEG
jgi:hypothetical protein